MNFEQEQKIQAKAAEQDRTSNPAQDYGSQETIGGLCGANKAQHAAPPSLRDRIAEQRHYAQLESRKAEQLMELEYLLDKHPAITRILDLLEAVKY